MDIDLSDHGYFRDVENHRLVIIVPINVLMHDILASSEIEVDVLLPVYDLRGNWDNNLELLVNLILRNNRSHVNINIGEIVKDRCLPTLTGDLLCETALAEGGAGSIFERGHTLKHNP